MKPVEEAKETLMLTAMAFTGKALYFPPNSPEVQRSLYDLLMSAIAFAVEVQKEADDHIGKMRRGN